jgi:hypothetical protein
VKGEVLHINDAERARETIEVVAAMLAKIVRIFKGVGYYLKLPAIKSRHRIALVHKKKSAHTLKILLDT